MILTKKSLGALAAVAALLFLLLLFPSRRREVLRTFGKVERLAAKEGEVNPVLDVLRAKNLADLLADDLLLYLPGEEGPVTVEREEARGLLLKLSREAGYLSVRFDALRVSFPARDRAETTGDITIESGSSRLDSFEEVPTFEATLIRAPGEGRWRFSRIVLRPVIEK